MDPSSVVQQALLFLHLIAFAIAMAEVLRADWRILRSSRIDVDGLIASSSTIKWTLSVLWVTGLALIYGKIGLDIGALFASAKLMTKLGVVAILTVNGVFLHRLALPAMQARGRTGEGPTLLAVILGAISTTSWVYAAFVGAARIVAPQMSLEMFLGLYGLALLLAIAVAVLFVHRLLAPICVGRSRPPGEVWVRTA